MLTYRNGRIAISREIRTELVRKGIHLLIAFVPFFARINLMATFLFLGLGTIVYAGAELLRFQGRRVFFISRVTEYAARERDRGKIVLGPVTLGLGAMASLFFYPEPAAMLAIFALAFGDGLASLFGKVFGKIRLPFTRGKTVAGSVTCFIAVFLITFWVVGDYRISILIASSATLLEAVPVKDLDNIIIPLGTGFAAYVLLV